MACSKLEAMFQTKRRVQPSAEPNLLLEWQRIGTNLQHVRFDRSPFVPQNFSDYLKHQSQYAAQQKEEAESP